MPLRFMSAMLLAGSTLSFATAAAAQNYTPSGSDEIIVTATKISSNVDDLGLSVAVLDGEALNRLDSAEEISQYLSGVQAAVANGTQIVFQTRGIGAVDHQALTPTATAVYIDGVFQATNVQTGPLLFDLERIEALKGPQGSLYGRNASAGAINFISKRPTDKNEGYVAAEIGNFERFNLNAAANVIVNEDVSLRVAGRYLTQGPTLDNVVSVEGIEAPAEAGGERDEFGLRAIGRYTPTNNTEVLLNLHYAEDNGVNPGPRNEGLDLGRHEISVGPDGIQDTDNEFYGANLQFSHSSEDIEFVSLTAFEGFNQQYGFGFGGRQNGHSFITGSTDIGAAQLTANLFYDRNLSQVSQEFRLSRSTENYKSLVGAYLEREEFDQDYLVFCGELNRETLVGSCNYIAASGRAQGNDPRDAAVSSLQSVIDQNRSTAALFTYNQYKLNPKLELVFGGRLTFENIIASGEGRHIFDDAVVAINNDLENGPLGRNTVQVGPAIGSNEINDTQFSGNIGLNYTPSDDILLYASYANGYKSGGFNGEVINNAGHFAETGLFGAETVDTYEIGAKYKNEKLRVSITGFYNDYDDPQARFFQDLILEGGQSVSLNALTNFNEASSFGVEGQFTYTPFQGFVIGGGATWLDTEINDSEQDSIDGNELPFASEFSGTLQTSYRWALASDIDARLSANAKYQSEFLLGTSLLNMDRSGEFTQSEYETIDARVEILFGEQIEFGLWARNLTNSDYATSAFRFDDPISFRSNPRQYGLSLKYSY